MQHADHSLRYGVPDRAVCCGFFVGILLCGLSPLQVLADEPLQRYGGYSLGEWQAIIKDSDLRTLGQQQYVNGLIDIVSDSSAPWASRKQAAETLGRIGAPAAAAIPVLHQLLLQPDEDQVDTLLWVLKSLALFDTVAESTAPDLAAVVLNPDLPHLVRINACEALGKAGKNRPVSLATFTSILRKPVEIPGSPVDELRVAAAEGLWLLGPNAIAALPVLLDASEAPWSPLRIAALETIGNIGPRAELAIPRLVDVILLDEAGEVREQAATALGRIGAAALPTLKKLLQDDETELRQFVMRALAATPRLPQTVEILELALQDDSPLIQVLAAAELIRRQAEHSAAQQMLISQLGSSKREARLLAYQTLFEHLRGNNSLQHKLRTARESGTLLDADRDTVRDAAVEKLLRKLDFEQLTATDREQLRPLP